MSDVKLEALDRWLTHGIWVQDHKEIARLVGFSIKCEPGQILAVAKGLTGEGPVVAFLQAPSILALYNRVGRGGLDGQARWRPDKFALDKFTKSE